jgi:serine/threonine protein kinase
MENGDLRSVLSRWNDEERRPQGFDSVKVKIALHIAHALTYLHSLQPVVVHRDLKSKNILLDARYDAKLTDFGVSRERADSTMTGGVGSSLWMAPEVMLGERYDEKADLFSFGVVLSELDTQQLPYAQAKESSTDRRLPDSAILQMVSLGRLEIRFSENAHPDLVQLGRQCVQLDASKRPTSAQVLHLVHQVARSFS